MKSNLLKILRIVCISLVIRITGLAQGGYIEFEESTFDFGQIKEEAGLVTHEFKFINKGTSPIILQDVKASCGCTTPQWTKEPVLPGKTGSIKAVFDPYNRPGVFDKTLTITSNSDPAMNFLKIKGFVLARQRTIKDLYPDTLGTLRLESRFLNMGTVLTSAPLVREFKIYNEGKEAMVFKIPTQVAKHLKIDILPRILAPATVGTIKVTYDARVKNDYGYLFDNFILPTNDKYSANKELSIVAVVADDFSRLTAEERTNAPKVTVTKETQELGELKSGTIQTVEFELTNIGKSDLIIKKIKSTCNCINAEADKLIAKPGEVVKIKAVFNTEGRTGKEFKNVYVYTNAPTTPEVVLNITANVAK